MFATVAWGAYATAHESKRIVTRTPTETNVEKRMVVPKACRSAIRDAQAMLASHHRLESKIQPLVSALENGDTRTAHNIAGQMNEIDHEVRSAFPSSQRDSKGCKSAASA